jgi:hypothetical protein
MIRSRTQPAAGRNCRCRRPDRLAHPPIVEQRFADGPHNGKDKKRSHGKKRNHVGGAPPRALLSRKSNAGGRKRIVRKLAWERIAPIEALSGRWFDGIPRQHKVQGRHKGKFSFGCDRRTVSPSWRHDFRQPAWPGCAGAGHSGVDTVIAAAKPRPRHPCHGRGAGNLEGMVAARAQPEPQMVSPWRAGPAKAGQRRELERAPIVESEPQMNGRVWLRSDSPRQDGSAVQRGVLE